MSEKRQEENRKPYTSPELVEWGTIEDITMAGVCGLVETGLKGSHP